MVLRWIFSADSRPFRRGLDQMRTETKAFGRSITRTMAGVFGSAAVVAGFRSWFMEMDRLDKAAKKLGASVEDLQRAKLISEQNNVSLQQLTNLLVRLQRRFGEAADGSDTYRRKLDSLGISQEKLQGSSPTQFLLALSSAWTTASGSATQYSDLLGLLDSESRELIPLLQEGPEALAEKFAKVNVVSAKTVAKMAEINDRLAEMKQNVSVGFGVVFQVVELLGKNAGNTIAVIVTAIRELITLIKDGLAGAFRSLNGVFTLNLDEIKAGVADMATAVDESIREAGRQAVASARESKEAWLDFFKTVRAESEKTRPGGGSRGMVFNPTLFNPELAQQAGANRQAAFRQARFFDPMEAATKPRGLLDFLRAHPIPFGDEAASRPRFGALPTTTLQSIGGNIGGNGAASADPSSRLLEIGQLQLAALQRIAANTAVSDDGTPNIPEPRVP